MIELWWTAHFCALSFGSDGAEDSQPTPCHRRESRRVHRPLFRHLSGGETDHGPTSGVRVQSIRVKSLEQTVDFYGKSRDEYLIGGERMERVVERLCGVPGEFLPRCVARGSVLRTAAQKRLRRQVCVKNLRDKGRIPGSTD